MTKMTMTIVQRIQDTMSGTDAPANRQRFEICEQCNKEYDVLYNDKKSCQWHQGKLHPSSLLRHDPVREV
jgi:hypothetical protein